MKYIIIMLLITILGLASGCKNDVPIDNGNRYIIEPIPFKYEEDGKWGFIDLSGKIIIEPTYEHKPLFYNNGYAIISSDTAYYYINLQGDTIGSYYYTANLFNDNRALIRDRNRDLFFIDEHGTIVFKLDTVDQGEVQRCNNFKNGLALIVTRNNRYGYIDRNGNITIEPQYSSASDFSEGLAIVEISNDSTNTIERILIDTTGAAIRKFDESFLWINPFNEGKASFKDTSGCGFINRSGEIIIKQQKTWENLSNFINGYACYMCGGDWGVIDSTGKKVLSSVYETPPFFYNGLAIVKENNKYGVINLKGTKVIETLYDHIAYPFIGERFYAKDGKYYLLLDLEGKSINDEEIYRIDLISIMNYSFKTGYVVVGETMGISLSALNTIASENNISITDLNNELRKLYTD